MNVMLLANLKDTIPSLFAACSKHACITILISTFLSVIPGWSIATGAIWFDVIRIVGLEACRDLL
jgi:hypothetical protein